MSESVLIKEIFESVQGEGPFVGVNQLFIRFSQCNLSCAYCDTDFRSGLKRFSVDELLREVSKYKNIHSISLTGGEPLKDADFLARFLPRLKSEGMPSGKIKVYLETNGTLFNELSSVIPYVDIVATDLKLNSSSKNGDLFNVHEKFLDVAYCGCDCVFLKIVFNENITEAEIQKSIDLAKKRNTMIVLQPQMNGEFLQLHSDFIFQTYYKFVENYNNVRLIPQTHKFLNIR